MHGKVYLTDEYSFLRKVVLQIGFRRHTGDELHYFGGWVVGRQQDHLDVKSMLLLIGIAGSTCSHLQAGSFH